MKSHFIQRLILKSTGDESGILIRHALTPDVLSSAFFTHRREYVPLRSAALIPAKHDASTPETELSLPKPKPEPKHSLPKLKPKMEQEVSTVTKPLRRMTLEHEQKIPSEADISVPKLVAKSKLNTIRKKNLTHSEINETELTPHVVSPFENKDEIQYIETKFLETPNIEPKEFVEDRNHKSRIDEEKKSRKGELLEDIQKQPQAPSLEKKLKPIENSLLKLPDSKILKHDKNKVIIKETKKRVESEEPLKLVPSEFEGIKQQKVMLPLKYARRYVLPQVKRYDDAFDHPEPTVNINIETVEVRAILPKRPAVKKEKAPILSLQDYLKQRQETK